MLKSFSTQLAATAFFGPIGLAYTSMATAVLFTLILAVLYFTGFGALAVLVIWPISIVTGVLYVKFHNDRVRQSGNRLLLGPGDESGIISTVGSWARGLAVLALVCGLGFFAYNFNPAGGETAPGRIVKKIVNPDASANANGSVNASANAASNAASNNAGNAGAGNQIAEQDNQQARVTSETSEVPVITLQNREIPQVIVDSSGRSTAIVAGESGRAVAQPILYVDREVVNLRQGPGTQFAIVTQLDRDEQVFEFARDGVWINIETQSGDHAGWIHGNLIRR